MVFNIERAAGNCAAHFVVMKDADDGSAAFAGRMNQLHHHPAVVGVE